MKTLNLRCSSLPIAFKCGGSVRPGEIAINQTNVQAEMGTCAHEALAVLVERGRIDWDAVPALARKHGADEAELRLLLAAGAKLWELVKDSFPDPLTEVSVAYDGDGFSLTGHADIIGRSGNEARVGDWKSGRLDSDYREQLLGYAALALREDLSLESATAGVLWVRDGDYEHYTMTRAQLGQWLERLRSEVIDWSGEYRPGGHCQYCKRSHECEAANALVRRDVAAIANLDLDDSALDALTPDQWVQIVEMASAVNKLSERVRSMAKARVIESGDIVGAGKRLTLQHTERRHLNVLQSFPVLEAQGFGDEEMAQVIEISAAKAEKIITERAVRGKGAAKVREFREQLEAAGAVETETVTMLVVRRA